MSRAEVQVSHDILVSNSLEYVVSCSEDVVSLLSMFLGGKGSSVSGISHSHKFHQQMDKVEVEWMFGGIEMQQALVLN